MGITRKTFPGIGILAMFFSLATPIELHADHSPFSSSGTLVENETDVGVVLDMGSWTGKTIHSCITMAISDFYASNNHYKTRLVLHTRDSRGDPLHAYQQHYDGAVGDITITANRSLYVDFTLPYTDIGVGTIAKRANNDMWVFLKPLSVNLWLTSAGFFVLTGLVVWAIEHPTNEEFQGSFLRQIGTILWVGFSTLVPAHREKLSSNLSRFVVIVWLFVVLILTSSYAASLSSMYVATDSIRISWAVHRNPRWFLFRRFYCK